MSLIEEFGKIYQVTRRGGGVWKQGRYQDGKCEIIRILASVQPLTPREVLLLPEARRTKESLNFFQKAFYHVE